MLEEIFHKVAVNAAWPYRLAPRGTDCGRTVVLVHGIMLVGPVMLMLGRFLCSQGFEVFIYDYRSSRDTIVGHGARLKKFLEELAADLPSTRPIDLVAHSMGGLLCRCAFGHLAAEQLPENECLVPPRFQHLVMICTPNCGSRQADYWLSKIPCGEQLVKSLPDLRYGEDAPAATLPVLRHLKIGIIAADRDHCVSEQSAHLETENDFIMLNGTHTGILFSTAAARQVSNFLLYDHFDHYI